MTADLLNCEQDHGTFPWQAHPKLIHYTAHKWSPMGMPKACPSLSGWIDSMNSLRGLHEWESECTHEISPYKSWSRAYITVNPGEIITEKSIERFHGKTLNDYRSSSTPTISWYKSPWGIVSRGFLLNGGVRGWQPGLESKGRYLHLPNH